MAVRRDSRSEADPRRRPTRRGARPQPVIRGRGVKVSGPAARMLRAGHPWVFRDSLLRPLEGVESGAVLPVYDPDGTPMGHGIVEPEGAIALRLVSRAEDFQWSDEVLAARVKDALDHRRRAIPAAFETACRLVHGEGDGLPGVAVDRLGDYLLLYKYSRSAEAWIDRLVPILQAELSPAGIYLQDRLRPVTPDDRRVPAFHVAGAPAPPHLVVEEAGLRHVVDITAPVSPGLFFDLREGRELVESLASGRRVLNLFSFTGSIGMRAVRGGAAEVVNVDAAAKAHARCRQSLEASGLDPEACEGIVGDAFAVLEKLGRRGRTFDLVIVDPPPFSRVKGRVFSALRNYQELLAAILPAVAPGGAVLVVANAARLSDDELMLAIGHGSADANRETRLVGERGLPVDFPVPPAFGEGRYLKIKLVHCVT